MNAMGKTITKRFEAMEEQQAMTVMQSMFTGKPVVTTPGTLPACIGLTAGTNPLMDLAASVDTKRMLVILCCLVLPVLGCYLHSERTDKYFWIGLVLSFLPPFGIIYALAYTQGGLRF
jgi:uncharacterized membrane protein YqaE (UPF0057 family)